jgi:hypothetical protein
MKNNGRTKFNDRSCCQNSTSSFTDSAFILLLTIQHSSMKIFFVSNLGSITENFSGPAFQKNILFIPTYITVPYIALYTLHNFLCF